LLKTFSFYSELQAEVDNANFQIVITFIITK
jgi:hypothetical protein